MLASRLIESAVKEGQKALNENESKQVLKEYGIPVVEEAIVHKIEEAVQTAKKIRFPVVLKALGSKIMHKTERNLVHLNLVNEQAVKKAFREISKEAADELEGVLVQPHVSGRRELVAGIFRDDLFGPVVMFGLGGIHTEAISDVVFRLAPISHFDAVNMIEELRAQKILGAYRGESAVDREALISVLNALSQIATDHRQIAEIDINPLVVGPDGRVCAVDGLVVIDSAPVTKSEIPKIDYLAINDFFHPKSIAFIGASASFQKWGYLMPLSTLAGGFEGDIYMVNPNGGTIFGKQVFKSVAEIPGKVDLAVVTIPAVGVIDLIPQLQEKGIKNMLVITSGFRETGKDGTILEKQLIEKARAAGIIIIGPNTMGICNPHINLCCLPFPLKPRPGSTALVCQSGNMGLQFLAFAEQQCIGIRGFCGTGNEAMMSVVDFMNAFEHDPITRIVMLYVESIKDGRRFFESARRISRKKPIVMLKGGQSSVGKKAASSHTGAIASNTRVFNAACKQAGIVQVDKSRKLLDTVAAFASLPLPKGNKVAIMTLGGGWGVLTADLCSRVGLEIPDLSSAVIKNIDKSLPAFWSKSNPVDIVATFDMSIPMILMEELIRWEGCDALINLGILGKKYFFKRVSSEALRYGDDFSKAQYDQLIKLS
ncbi:acetate--CoA ligase family protein, partial [bacterium]|nr:acetate--CoA ligase family protein [bacterium]